MSDERIIGQIQSDIEYLKKGMDKMGDKLDILATEWQKFGGLYKEQKVQNDRIIELNKWKEDVEPVIYQSKEYFENRKRLKWYHTEKLFSLLWEMVKYTVVAVISVIITLIGFENLK